MSIAVVYPVWSYSWSKISNQIAEVLRSNGFNVEVIPFTGTVYRFRMYRNMIIVGDILQMFRAITPYAQYVIWYFDAPSVMLRGNIVKLWFMGVEYKYRFVPNSHWAKTVLESYGLKNIEEPIPHGIDTSVWYPQALQDKPYHFIYYSLYHERKGFDRLVELCRKMPDYRFRVMSNCLLREKVQFPSNVTVDYDLATLTEKELYERVLTARVYIQVSYYEGFGITTLESYIAGLNIVAPDVKPFNEYLPRDDVLWVEAYHDYEHGLRYEVRYMGVRYSYVIPKITWNMDEFMKKMIEALKKPVDISKRLEWRMRYDYRRLYRKFIELLR